jgi:clan AA aspartic protease
MKLLMVPAGSRVGLLLVCKRVEGGMGQMKVSLTLYPRHGGTPRSLEALVDTGAGYSVIPRPVLEALGCRAHRAQRVIMADGRIEEWQVTQIDVECAGRRTTTPVLMGPPGGPALLGATTLEELGLGIDPLNRRLIPVDLYLATLKLPEWRRAEGTPFTK